MPIDDLLVQFEVKSSPMHPLSGALCWLHVRQCSSLGAVFFVHYSWCITIGASHRSCLLAVELLSIAGPLCPSQYLVKHLNDPLFDGVGLPGFNSGATALLVA